MKILFYTPMSLLAGGGGERFHCDITQALKKRFSMNVEIVSGNLGKKRWTEKYLRKQLPDIPHIQLNYLNLFGILIPTPSILIFLYKKFKQQNIIFFVHGFFGQDILMALLKFITNKKVIVLHYAPILYNNGLHNFYMKYISRYILNFFNFHQTLNIQDKLFLENKWRIKNVYFIPGGVRIEKFLRVKKRPHDKLVFISIARYELQKGIDLLIKAIEKFNQTFKNNKAVFRIVGDGSLKLLVKSYVKIHKNIMDSGYADYESLPKIYSESDIYLLPSREETFGLVLVEAWSCGIPVLATKTEGPKDMLQPEINGWFIEKTTINGIYKSISTIYNKYLNHNLNLNQYIKSCRNTGKKFSIDSTAEKMKTLFC